MRTGSSRWTRLAVVAVYATAMAVVEAMVVYYLRRLFALQYAAVFTPGRFVFPPAYLRHEQIREAATIVMLLAVAFLAGRGLLQKLAYFLLAFGVWDIGYYFWLWMFVGWPHGPGTWDVLFLIPIPWAGPVWAPIAVSLALVGFGLAAAQRCGADRAPKVHSAILAGAIAGGIIVIASFLANGPALLDGGLPGWYPWPIFVLGMSVASLAAVMAIRGGAGNIPRSRG